MKVNFEIHDSHIPLWEKDNFRYAQLLGKEYIRGAIMRATREDIRASSWLALNDRIIEQGIERAFRITDNDMVIERGQNSVRAHGFRASSGSLTARLKSLEGYNFVWIEEAEEIGESEFMKLDDTLRTTKGKIRIILTLNTPPKNHWVIKRWFNLEPAILDGFHVDGFYIPKLKDAKDVIYIPGTFRENLPNLDPVTIQRYQGYRETKPAHYWQMIEGLSPEVVLGRIYSGWRMIDGVPHEARLIGYGLDFGFDPDPAAILAIYWYNGGYILDEKLYQTKLLNAHLISTLQTYQQAPIVPDSAEPKSITELQYAGLNVVPAEKGADSVRNGIKHLQGLKISFTRSSVNLREEYENYAWKLNKDGDNIGIPDPNCADHLLDAARYGLTTLAQRGSAESAVVEKQVEVFINRQNRKHLNDTR
jgi:phage terminase large subunit